jgi:hypothetical protein
LLEQPLKWFEEPRKINLPYKDLRALPIGDEVLVTLKLNGEEQSVVVPSGAVDRKGSRVTAWAVARADNFVLIDLPPSSFGSNRLKIRKALFDEIAAVTS